MKSRTKKCKPGLVYVLMTVYAFLFSGCGYKTIFEGPYSDDLIYSTGEIYSQIVFTRSGELVLTDPYFTNIKTMPEVDNIALSAINYRHDLIAYKINGNDIVICDTAFQIMGTVPGSEEAIFFDFHANNETLYYLTEDGAVGIYGPEIPRELSHINELVTSSLNTIDAHAIVIAPDGAVVVAYSHFINGQGDVNRIAKLRPGSNAEFYDPDYQVNSLRMDESGDKYFVSVNSGSGQDFETFYGLMQQPGLKNYYQSSQLSAISPDGEYVLLSKSNNNIIVKHEPGFVYRSPNYSNITSLDW